MALRHGQPSVMPHAFGSTPRADIPRSKFSLNHGIKTTLNSDFLIPFYRQEVLPGDTHSVTATLLARLQNPIHPFMDNMYLKTEFFFVPNRIAWVNWEKFNGAQDDPGDSTSFLIPQMVAPAAVGHILHSVADYLSIPTDIPLLTHSSLYHRAYNRIFRDWYRSEDLQNSPVIDTDDGPDLSTDYPLLRRGKAHDYYTAALPFSQKGPAVTMPLGTSAPILVVPSPSTTPNLWLVASTRATMVAQATNVSAGSAPVNATPADMVLDPNGQMIADLSSAISPEINVVREAFQMQKLLERDARGGTRYTEILRAHFGVVSPDSRLQRAELLSTGRTSINVHPVVQTSESGTTAQGNLAAYADGVASGHGFSKSFTEHGIILGFVSITADLNYQEGLNRDFSRLTRFEYYWPALSHTGEQAILNKEILADASAADELVFGYIPRYDEYRHKPSQITGKFRSSATGSLDPWHLAQDFAGVLPVLGASFIESNTPVARVVVVTSEPEFYLDGFIRQNSARPMPTDAVPGFVDHF